MGTPCGGLLRYFIKGGSCLPAAVCALSTVFRSVAAFVLTYFDLMPSTYFSLSLSLSLSLSFSWATARVPGSPVQAIDLSQR